MIALLSFFREPPPVQISALQESIIATIPQFGLLENIEYVNTEISTLFFSVIITILEFVVIELRKTFFSFQRSDIQWSYLCFAS